MKLGDKVVIVRNGVIYPTFKDAFALFNFQNKERNDAKNGQVGVIENIFTHFMSKETVFHVKWDGGEVLINESGVQPYVEKPVIEKALPPEVKTVQDFIERFFPGYYSSELIGSFNDVDTWLKGEGGRFADVPRTDTTSVAMIAQHNHLLVIICHDAIDNFIKSQE